MTLRASLGRRRRLSDDTLSQRASLNMLAAVLDYGARIVVGLVVTPILVSRLGDLVFGVYQTLGRLVGFATPAGGRPSQALKWTIARQQHSTEFEEKRLQVGSALAVWVIFLPVLALAGGILAWVAPLLLGLPERLHLTVRVAAALLVVDLIVTNLLAIPRSVLEGENLGYKRMGLSTLIVLLGGALTVVVAVLGGGLIGVAACVLATTSLTGLLFLRVTRRNVHWFGMARPRLRAVRSFLTLSGWFLAWNLVIQIMRGSDVVLLGIATAPEEVTVYALSRYVPEAIFSVVAIVIAGIMPGLGGVMGAGQTRRAADVRSESMTVTWLLATAAGAAYLLIQESFLGLWVGPEYYPGDTAAVLIVLMILQFALIRNDASIIDLTLELRGKVLLGLLSAGASIGLAILFITAWDSGITGLALGFIAGRSIVSVAYPWFVCRSLDLSPLGDLKAAVRPACVSAILFAGALALAQVAEVHSWFLLLPLAACSLAVSAAASLFLGLSAHQRRRVSRRARQVLRRA